MENIPTHRELFQFIEILQLISYIVDGDRERWKRIKMEFASTSVPK